MKKQFVMSGLSSLIILSIGTTGFADTLPVNQYFVAGQPQQQQFVKIGTPSGQSPISSVESNYIASLPTDKQQLVRALINANINQTTQPFEQSAQGKQLISDLEADPNFASGIFEHSDANNPAFQTSVLSKPVPAGSTITYIFPDGSQIIRSAKVTLLGPSTIQSVNTGNLAYINKQSLIKNILTKDSLTKKRMPHFSSLSPTYLGGNNYQVLFSYSDSVVAFWVTDNLYTDFNPIPTSNGCDVDIYSKLATASSFGPGWTAASNGDAQVTANWGPYSSDEADYSDGISVNGINSNWTEVLTTNFNGNVGPGNLSIVGNASRE